MDTKTLTEKIKNFARTQARFDLIGISKASLPAIHHDAIERWVEKGYAGSMAYMVRDGVKRADALKILPQAKSVISLAIHYNHPEDPKPSDRPVGKVSKYAYGADYHKIIEKKLKALTLFIKEMTSLKKGISRSAMSYKEFVSDVQIKTYVDTGPILEKAFAKESGLGFFGKNTNIITKQFGSFIFLASLISDLELEPDAPHTSSCGSCRICLEACPTDALLGDYQMDARRCISYLTIESKEEIPEELKKGVGEWVFGCDICQDVCPYNAKAKTTTHEEWYASKKAGTWIDLERTQAIKSDEEFAQMFQGSPIKRSKRSGLQRNAKVVLENVVPTGDRGEMLSYDLPR